MLFVLRGSGNIRGEGDDGDSCTTIEWASGDLLTMPAFKKLSLAAVADAALYYVHDAPLLAYLGVAPT